MAAHHSVCLRMYQGRARRVIRGRRGIFFPSIGWQWAKRVVLWLMGSMQAQVISPQNCVLIPQVFLWHTTQVYPV